MAYWDISAPGASFEYDTLQGQQPAAAKVDDTHILNIWQGDAFDGFAQVFSVNTSTGALAAVGSAVEFDTSSCVEPSIVQVDSNHFLVLWQNTGGSQKAQILSVNLSTYAVTAESSPLTFEASYATGNNIGIAQYDSTHFLISYTDGSLNNWAQMLAINTSTWAVTEVGTPVEFDATYGTNSYLSQIDSTHFLVTWGGAYPSVEAQVLLVNSGNYNVSALGSPINVTTTYDTPVGLIKLDSTHFLTSYGGFTTDYFQASNILTVDTGTWAVTTNTETSPFLTGFTSVYLKPISKWHFALAYSDTDGDGRVKTLRVNNSNWTISEEGTEFEFDATDATDPTLVEVTHGFHVVVYNSTNQDGFMRVLNMNPGPYGHYVKASIVRTESSGNSAKANIVRTESVGNSAKANISTGVTYSQNNSVKTNTPLWFGNNDVSGVATGSLLNITLATKYTLSHNAVIDHLYEYCPAGGNIKGAIYSDVGGVPTDLLASNNTGVAVSANGWVKIAINQYLPAGTYWLVFKSDTTGNAAFKAGGSNQAAYNLSTLYVDDFPASFPTPSYQDNDYISFATYTIAQPNSVKANIVRTESSPNSTKANIVVTNTDNVSSKANIIRVNETQANSAKADILRTNETQANQVKGNITGEVRNSVKADILRVDETQANSVKADIIRVNETQSNSSKADILRVNETQNNSVKASIVRTETSANQVKANLVATTLQPNEVKANILAVITQNNSVKASIQGGNEQPNSVKADILRVNETVDNSVKASIVRTESSSNQVKANIVAPVLQENSVKADILRANETQSNEVKADILRANETQGNSVKASIVRTESDNNSVKANIVAVTTQANSVKADILRVNDTVSNNVKANILRTGETVSSQVKANIVETISVSNNAKASIVRTEPKDNEVKADILNTYTQNNAVKASIVGTTQAHSSTKADILRANEQVGNSVKASIVRTESSSNSVKADIKVTTSQENSAKADIIRINETVSNNVKANILQVYANDQAAKANILASLSQDNAVKANITAQASFDNAVKGQIANEIFLPCAVKAAIIRPNTQWGNAVKARIKNTGRIYRPYEPYQGYVRPVYNDKSNIYRKNGQMIYTDKV